MSFLETFKQKPVHVKSRYAFLGALIFTLAVAGVWATTLPARFNDIRHSVNGLSEQSPMSNTGAALNGLTDTLSAEQDGLPQNGSADNTFDFSGEPATPALNELSGPYTNDETYVPESSLQVATSTNISTDQYSQSVGTTSANPLTVSPQKDQTPRIILIATTTTKNNE